MSRRKLMRTAALLPLAFVLAGTGAQAARSLNGKDGPKRGGPRSETTETTTTTSPSATTTAATTTSSAATTQSTTTTTTVPTSTTVPTTTTTGPTVSGTLLEQIDYSQASSFGWSWGIQAGNYGFTDSAHVGTVFEAVTDPNGGARKVEHAYLPARSSGGRAAEGLYRREIDLGVTDFYGLSIRVPVGWHTIPQNSSWHTVAAQFNYGSLGGPPISLVVQPGDLEVMMLTGHVAADSSGNATGYEFQASPNAGTRLYLTQNLAAHEGQWIDVILEVKWATTWNGYVNAWIRTQGGSWVQAVNTLQTFGRLVPTQQWGSNVEGHTVDANGIDASTGKPYVTCDKAGLYAGPGPTPMNFWESTFLRGTTFDAVASRMP